MILWYTVSLVRWMVCMEQSIEYAMEFASANETDIPNLNRRVPFSWVRLPQGIAETRICDCELIAKSIIVCH